MESCDVCRLQHGQGGCGNTAWSDSIHAKQARYAFGSIGSGSATASRGVASAVNPHFKDFDASCRRRVTATSMRREPNVIAQIDDLRHVTRFLDALRGGSSGVTVTRSRWPVSLSDRYLLGHQTSSRLVRVVVLGHRQGRTAVSSLPDVTAAQLLAISEPSAAAGHRQRRRMVQLFGTSGCWIGRRPREHGSECRPYGTHTTCQSRRDQIIDKFTLFYSL